MTNSKISNITSTRASAQVGAVNAVVNPVNPQQNNAAGRQVNLPIAAGQVVRIQSAGNQFYLVVATAPVNIRPDGGDFSLYQQGTGSHSSLSDFKSLEVQNPNTVPVVISCWVGFDSFIDNRLIIANTLTPNVAKPTQTTPTATAIDIPDVSGAIFSDINGNEWVAIQRTAILVFNTDSATTLYLQGAGASTASGPAVGVIYALTPVRFDFSGHYSISAGGGTIPAIVSEIYIAVAYNP